MPMPAPQDPAAAPTGDGRLVANIMHFGRVLRAAGLPIGPGRVLQAIEAVAAVGPERRADFYWALHAVFVNRQDQRELFDQAFHVFWRNPDILKRLTGLLLPPVKQAAGDPGAAMARRLAEALGKVPGPDTEVPEDQPAVEVDAAFTWSDRDLLQTKDFEAMSTEELAEAKALMARMRWPAPRTSTRRWRPERTGRRIDPRATLRRSLKPGGVIDLARRAAVPRHPPLVVLCDISGSMSRYSRMLLHFLHAVTNDRDRVHTFLFGTRLTNVTRYLRHRDVDVALEKIGAAVEDWSGGTRIGTSLETFNRLWSRRVLGQGAVVLLITDGLDRDAGEGLAAAMDRLHRSCRRLIWLNPLLRYDAFAPKSTGARAMMPHVDDFRPVHNLQSLRDLAQIFDHAGPRRDAGMARWLEAVP